jgi:hypothetical protein
LWPGKTVGTAQERHNSINKSEQGEHIGSSTAQVCGELKRFCAPPAPPSKRNGAMKPCTEGQ